MCPNLNCGFYRVLTLAYPNLLGIKGFVDVVAFVLEMNIPASQILNFINHKNSIHVF
jgi:hypothetical protein